MPEISGRTLALSIQAVDIEIHRLDSLHEDVIVPDDQELLVQYYSAAEELEKAYAEVTKKISNLPPYARLVRPRD